MTRLIGTSVVATFGLLTLCAGCGPKPDARLGRELKTTTPPPAYAAAKDVPLDSRAEQEFAAALIARSPDVLATVPDGDSFAREVRGQHILD